MIKNKILSTLALITISITNFSCSANGELDAVKKTDKQSAKIEFRYTQNEHIKHDKGKGKYFTLDVFGEFLNGKAVFEHENYNTVKVGWESKHSFYQEMECPAYDNTYLCVPSIKLVLSIQDFIKKSNWKDKGVNFNYKGRKEIELLSRFGPVDVISSHIGKDEYVYYISKKYGVVGFSINSNVTNAWILNTDEPFGVGAISLSRNLKLNSPLESSQKEILAVKTM